jgi:Domain of unknown function (DUF4258)
MIRYDEHAEFQIARRAILKAWVEQTLREPDLVEDKGSRRSYFKCLPGRRIMLRVVALVSDPEYIITAYFDRTKPCV